MRKFAFKELLNIYLLTVDVHDDNELGNCDHQQAISGRVRVENHKDEYAAL